MGKPVLKRGRQVLFWGSAWPCLLPAVFLSAQKDGYYLAKVLSLKLVLLVAVVLVVDMC